MLFDFVKSFFKFHGIEVKGEFPLKRKVKYLDKIPTRNELKLILNAAPSLSTKIGIQLMAYGGLRPEDIYDLTYASIKRDFENKLVAEKELESYLNNGWEMVQTVNSKILVRKKA